MKTLPGLCICLAGSLRQWWALPLRLMVGYGFMAHGSARLARARFGQPG
jgi:uncharacterized membrane protein YphA (DoxX/SURF4 family)